MRCLIVENGKVVNVIICGDGDEPMGIPQTGANAHAQIGWIDDGTGVFVPPPAPSVSEQTPEERIAELEQELADLRAMIEAQA